MAYIGRFAPSPTGPLHMGSLLAALASYLDAQAHYGTWLLRIDNIDPPREKTGATQQIINCLRTHGLHWHGAVQLQSKNSQHYENALATLKEGNLLFPCSCSRKQLSSTHAIHPPSCITHHTNGTTNNDFALRIRTTEEHVRFNDLYCGAQSQNLNNQSGPYIVKRKDDLYAYHLACVVDDARSNISHIVRGDDLLESTFAHIHLQRCLNYPTPFYTHIPVLHNADGSKLSKQTGAAALDNTQAYSNLFFCCQQLLGTNNTHSAPQEIKKLLTWATRKWAEKNDIST